MMGKTVSWISLRPTANNRLAPNQYATAPSGLLWQSASNSPVHLRHRGMGLIVRVIRGRSTSKGTGGKHASSQPGAHLSRESGALQHPTEQAVDQTVRKRWV